MCQYGYSSARTASLTWYEFLYAHRVLEKVSEALGEEVGFVLAVVEAALEPVQSLA